MPCSRTTSPVSNVEENPTIITASLQNMEGFWFGVFFLFEEIRSPWTEVLFSLAVASGHKQCNDKDTYRPPNHLSSS